MRESQLRTVAKSSKDSVLKEGREGGRERREGGRVGERGEGRDRHM